VSGISSWCQKVRNVTFYISFLWVWYMCTTWSQVSGVRFWHSFLGGELGSLLSAFGCWVTGLTACERMSWGNSARRDYGKLAFAWVQSITRSIKFISEQGNTNVGLQELSKPRLATPLYACVLVTYLLSYLGTYLFTRLLTRYVLQPLLYKLSKIVLI